jgi:hypothetical protein
LRRCSQDEGKKRHPKRQKKAPARHLDRRSTPEVCFNPSRLLEIERSSIFPFTESAPPPRVDIKDTATAESGVTTLDRVTVSDRKKGMIYIKVKKGSVLTPAVGWEHSHSVNLILHTGNPRSFQHPSDEIWGVIGVVVNIRFSTTIICDYK